MSTGTYTYNGLSTEDRKVIFLVALKELDGNVTGACKTTNMSRQTYYNWMSDDEEFATSVRMIELQVTDEMLDEAEAVIRFAVKRSDVKTVRWVLSRLGRGRGYGNKIEVAATGDAFKGNEWPDHPPTVEEWEQQTKEPETKPTGEAEQSEQSVS